MNTETQIIEHALQALQQRTGIKGIWRTTRQDYDGIIDLKIKDRKIRFYVETKKEVRPYHLDKIFELADLHKPLMVVAENIAKSAKDKLRSEGIAYLETNGNAYIDYDYITILIDGNKPIREVKPVTNRAFTKTGLRLVFLLLNDPQAILYHMKALRHCASPVLLP